MTERDMENAVIAALESAASDGDMLDEFLWASSYRDRGLLTNNKGVVVRFKNGDEFQLQIVQSERGRDDDTPDEEEE